MTFGDISLEELSNNPYKPDPGADAVVLYDVGVARLNYENGFYVEFERDVRIRIVNSNGFDYANIEIPYMSSDKMISYKASTFNSRNGEIIETKIPKKSFMIEKTTKSFQTIKFNFPDVHEGSVIEYSYVQRLNSSLAILVPWEFQTDIPVIYSCLKVSFPEYFIYKSIISGAAEKVGMDIDIKKANYAGEYINVHNMMWYYKDVPAFSPEPYIMSKKESLTKVRFELARINFPGISLTEISPTYETLTGKLLDRDDFGIPLKTDFKALAQEVTKDKTDNLSKLKSIHEYVSSNILWNGEKDFTSSEKLKSVLYRKKGNSADINMILIAMLRSVGIKADPLILSTRSNGSLNQYSAMLQQFNYLVAYVIIEGEPYLVDATDPLRPFNVLPFDCLNGVGRLINDYESKFIDMKNIEKFYSSSEIEVTLDKSGMISGNVGNTYSDYRAYNVRKLVKLESEEGYIDILRSRSPSSEIFDFKIENLQTVDENLNEAYNFSITDGAQIAGDEIIFNPDIASDLSKNPFYSSERNFPVDFGCPLTENYNLRIKIPQGYSVTEKPENIVFNIGKDDGKFAFRCEQAGDVIEISSSLEINKTIFLMPEYADLRNFYNKIIQKQAELIVFKKNSVIN
jgi:hypothetical protein